MLAGFKAVKHAKVCDGLALVIGMYTLHSDLSSMRQEARQHMVQLAGELQVTAVTVLADKSAFSFLTFSLSVGLHGNGGLRDAFIFSAPSHRYNAKCLCRKTPPLTQLIACNPIKI